MPPRFWRALAALAISGGISARQHRSQAQSTGSINGLNQRGQSTGPINGQLDS